MAQWQAEDIKQLRQRAAMMNIDDAETFWVGAALAETRAVDREAFLQAALADDEAMFRRVIQALNARRVGVSVKRPLPLITAVGLLLVVFLLILMKNPVDIRPVEIPQANFAAAVAWNEMGAGALEKGRFAEAWLYSLTALNALSDDASQGSGDEHIGRARRAEAVGRFFHPNMARAGDLLWQSPSASPVGAVAVSSSGLIALGGADHQIRLLDARTGTRRLTLSGHHGPVLRLAFLYQGRLLASIAADGGGMVWDLRREPVTAYPLETGDLAFQPSALAGNDSGSLVVSGGTDGSVHVFRPSTAPAGLTVAKPLRFHFRDTAISAAAVAAAGKRAAVAGEGITVFDPSAGRVRWRLSVSSPVRDLLFLADGVHLVAAFQDGSLQILDTDRKQVHGQTQLKAPVMSLDLIGGQRFAAGARDGSLGVWDAASLARPLSLTQVSEPVFDLAVDAAGGLIYAVEGDSLMGRRLNHDFGELLVQPAGHEHWLCSVAYDPAGEKLVSTSLDGTLRLWDAVSGEEGLVLRGHRGEVWDAVFSPDGKLIYSVSSDQTIRVWNSRTGEETAVWRGHEDRVNHIALRPDGAMAATASHDGSVRLWDVGTGAQISILQGHSDWVWSVAFDEAGKRLASVSKDQSVRLWDLATGDQLMILRGHEKAVRDAAFHPDGNLLATVSGDQTVRIWDLNLGETVRVLNGHGAWVFACAFSPDGELLATASEDQTLRLWDVTTGVEVHQFVHNGDWVHSTPIVRDVVFHPDGDQLATAFEDGRVMVWALPGDGPRESIGVEAQVRGLAWRPNHNVLAVSGRDGVLRLVDPNTGEVLRRLTQHDQALYGLAFDTTGRYLATTSNDATVRLWDMETGADPLVLPGQTYWSGSPAFSPAGDLLASPTADFTIAVWDVPSGEERLVLRGHEHFVSGVAFHPNGELLAGASNDRTLSLWDLSDGRRTATLRGHGERVYDVTFDPAGGLLASASADGTVRLWDTSGHAVAVLQGHLGAVFAVAFRPDGRYLFSASNDRTIRMWNPLTGEAVATLGGHQNEVIDLAFSPNGDLLAGGGDDYSIRFFRMGPTPTPDEALVIRAKRAFGFRREGFRFRPDPKYRFRGVNGFTFPNTDPLDVLDQPRPLDRSLAETLEAGG